MAHYANGGYGGVSYATRKRERDYGGGGGGGGSAAYTNAALPYPYYPTPVGAGYYDYDYGGATPATAAPRTAGYDYDYPAATYPSRHRRPSDPGPNHYEPKPVQFATKRSRATRASEEIVPASRKVASTTLKRTPTPTRPLAHGTHRNRLSDYIFVSLSSHNILKVANMDSIELGEELRYILHKYWRDGTVDKPTLHKTNWQVALGGDVWTANGYHGIKARRFIRGLFIGLRQAGYGYLTTIGSHPFKPPRMVFTNIPPEETVDYFMISFSMNHRTVHIIDAPDALASMISKAIAGKALPSVPGEFKSPARLIDKTDDGLWEVTTDNDGQMHLVELMGATLKMIAAEGWLFEASVPFGRCGIFGYRGRREVWMFRRAYAPEDRRYADFEPAYPEERYRQQWSR